MKWSCQYDYRKNEIVGIIGYPVGYSLSPLMHNSAFKALHGCYWPDLKNIALVCELIYTPMTRFLTYAQSRGHMVTNGTGMLVEQGELAFELWTGQIVPRNIMFETLAKFILNSISL